MRYVLLITCTLLAACDAIRSTSGRVFGGSKPTAEAESAQVDTVPEPDPAVVSSAGWVGAKSTIAGLGDPSKPGRWLETSLVETEVTARVVVPRTGAQAYITLVPVPGPEGGGSRLSLDAMRALLLPFDELVELEVYSN